MASVRVLRAASGVRAKASAAVFVCGALLCGAGCQLVFGIDDYEIDGAAAGNPATGGQPSDGGGGTGAVGGQGGEPSNGGAPPSHCTCDLDATWVPMNLDRMEAVDGPFPDCASAGVARAVLFDGRPTVACHACDCEASGCEVQGIECFSGPSCGGGQRHLDPGAACSDIGGGGCKSFQPTAAPSAPVCELQPDSGQPTVADPAFERYLLFCGVEECGAGCRTVEAECVVAENFTAAECPGGFPNRYEIDAEGAPSCEACACEPSCTGPWYGAGAAGNCGIVGLLDGCTTIALTNAYAVARITEPRCLSNHPALYTGSYEVTARRTVCCQAPINDLPPPG